MDALKKAIHLYLATIEFRQPLPARVDNPAASAFGAKDAYGYGGDDAPGSSGGCINPLASIALPVLPTAAQHRKRDRAGRFGRPASGKPIR